MRVTQYQKVTAKQFQNKGKDLFLQLNSLKNFVSQQNRTTELSLVLKKHDDFDGGCEMLASMRNTMFAEIQEDNNMMDSNEIQIRDDASDDESNINSLSQIMQEEQKVGHVS